jgi:hypothetical protein
MNLYHRSNRYLTGLLVLFAVLLVSCVSPRNRDYDGMSSGDSPMMAQGSSSDDESFLSAPLSASSSSGSYDINMAFTPKFSAQNTQNPVPKERKVYYEAYLTLEVSNVDKTIEKIKDVLKSYEGFTVFISNTYVKFRVKSSDLNKLIDHIGTLGDLTRKNINGQDITDDYLDTKIRLENAYKARDRYLELIQKAVTVEEMVKVEAELQRTTEKIELMEGRIKRYDQQVEYSLVEIYVAEEKSPGPLGWIFVGIYEGIKWLFVW